MHLSFESDLLIVAVLLVLSVFASKLSDRLGIPVLLVFLGIGMLAGSEGPGGIYFDDPGLAQAIGSVALAIILFSGGLNSVWEQIYPVRGQGLALATLGVLITTLVVGMSAHWILGVPILQGVLVGAIVSSTDAAAVFAILRSTGIRLRGQLAELLEFESGSNDPMAVFLTIGIIQLILDPGKPIASLAVLFLQQMLIGGILGVLAGRLLLLLLRRMRLAAVELYSVLFLGGALLAFGGTTLLGGSGFLAVYLAGLVVGREQFQEKIVLVHFFESLAWLSQIGMFLTLGLLVFPSRLAPVILPGLALALILILVARPLSVWASLSLTRLRFADKAFVAWVGLRGAVPIILATYPELAGIPESGLIFNLVFFVVLTSALAQGSTLPLVARWLRVIA